MNRTEFLIQLEQLNLGVAKNETIQQSSCIAFRDGYGHAFDGRVMCWLPIPAIAVNGAVPAAPLIETLKKFDAEEVDVESAADEIVIKSGRRSAGLRIQKEIVLPIDNVSRPEKWQKLPSGFLDAIQLACICTASESSDITTSTCVHIHPRWIEACDNYQMIRYQLKTGLKDPVLVPGDSASKIVGLELSKFALSKSWLHFQGDDLEVSLLLSNGKYPSLDKLMGVEGEQIELPEGILDTADRAKVFTSGNKDDAVVIDLKPNEYRLRGEGPFGWYKETGKLNYDGPEIKFRIAPSLLRSLMRLKNRVELSQDRIKVTGDRFVYVSCIGKA